METRGETLGRDGWLGDCNCRDADAALPCWPCYREGFDIPNSNPEEHL